MPHIRIDLNGTTEFDGDLSEWTHEMPFIEKYLRPGVLLAPHIRAGMVAIMDALSENHDSHIDVRETDRGWQMEVRNG